MTGPLFRRCGHRAAVQNRSQGSVTAEFAVVLPALTVLLALLLLGAGAGIVQLRLEDAARSAARALARGDSAAQAVATAGAHAGSEVEFSVSFDGDFATVTARGRVAGPLAGIVPWKQSATATARIETGLDAAAASAVPGSAGSIPGDDLSAGAAPDVVGGHVDVPVAGPLPRTGRNS